MKRLHFAPTYCNNAVVDDPETGIRIEIDEQPSMDIESESYSFRISTRHIGHIPTHREYAIEHHARPHPHPYPHLQFKFHTEEIGQFRIRIDISDINEYQRCILGFIFKAKGVVEQFESEKEGITQEVFVVKLVDKLERDAEFLTQKITDGITKYAVDFDEREKLTRYLRTQKATKLKDNALLASFLSPKNVRLIEQSAQISGKQSQVKR